MNAKRKKQLINTLTDLQLEDGISRRDAFLELRDWAREEGFNPNNDEVMQVVDDFCEEQGIGEWKSDDEYFAATFTKVF